MNDSPNKPEKAVPAVWRRESVTRNPYHFNAFRVAGVPVDLTERSWVAELIGQRRHLMAASPGVHAINGVPVSESDVNQAELILGDPRRRLIEELLTQAPAPADPRPLLDLDARLEEAMRPPSGESGIPGPNLLVLGRKVCSIWLHDHAPHTAFGANELLPVRPWGGRAV